MTDQELIAYYQTLLIIQYANKARALGTVGALIEQLIANQIIQQVADTFDLDTSIGVQLQAVATYRGAQRDYFGFDPSRAYFTTPDYSDTDADSALGFMEYDTDPATVYWLFLTYEDSNRPVYALSDYELRRLTEFLAKTQGSNMTLKTLDDVFFEFFGNNAAIFDNENMTMLYVHLSSDADTLFAVIAFSMSFPHPAGVAVQSFEAELLTDWFGMQDYDEPFDASFAGFSDYSDIVIGTFISYP